MSTRTRTNNLLAKRHFNRVVRRNWSRCKKLFPLWAITWNLRGRTRVPLGTASMMVMSSTLGEGSSQLEQIDLACVVGQAVPDTGCVQYADIRMRHDFSKNPHAGARGVILDPRETNDPTVQAGDKPNADWVRLALEVDQARVRAGEQNYQLPVVPKLPRFLLGFSSMDVIDFELSEALVEVIAAHMEQPVKRVMAEKSTDELTMLGKVEWPNLFIPPNTADNATNFWLLDHKFTKAIPRAARIFEDFSELVGVDVRNPVRDLGQYQYPNPIFTVASKEKINLREVLEGFAAATAANENVLVMDSLEDTLMSLIPKMREHIGGINKLFTDEDLSHAIVNPEDSLVSSKKNLLTELGDVEALKVLRQYLAANRPLVDKGATDEDLMKALENPAQPLFASRYCGIQVLRRDLRIGREQAFNFNPTMLERDRVSCNLWVNQGWSPSANQLELAKAKPRRSRRSRSRKAKTQHASSQSV